MQALRRGLLLALVLAFTAAKAAAEEDDPIRRILLFGPPAVGKGTQARRLVERYGVCHISTGDMLRAEASAAKPSPIGKRAKAVMARGGLLPDHLMIRMVKKRLRKDKACRKKGWLLDGFPRTPIQAHALLAAGLVPHHIVVLNATHETVLARVRSRAAAAAAKGEAPRADDNEATMLKRLEEYERNKAATLYALRRYLRVANIDGGASVAAVSEGVASALGAGSKAVPAGEGIKPAAGEAVGGKRKRTPEEKAAKRKRKAEKAAKAAAAAAAR